MKKWFQATLLRYFLSYFIVFCLSVVGMFLLFRGHLISTLTSQYQQQITNELNTAVSRLGNEISSLYTIHTQVVGNVDVMMAKYTDDPHQAPMIRSELKKYVVGKNLIQAIGYIDRTHGEMYYYSLKDYLLYEDGQVIITDFNAKFSFCPDDYYSAGSNQLIKLTHNGHNRFVYLPVSHSFYNYAVFFVLDNASLEEACRSLLSDMVLASAIIAPDGTSPVCSRSGKTDFSSLDGKDVFLSDPFMGGYSLAALYSSETLSDRIAQALTEGMPWYILISVAGFILVALCTFTTYHPLHRLASKFKGQEPDNLNLFNRLDQAIKKQQTQNDNLRTRIEHYRTIMQKMLLDSVLLPGSENKNPGPDIDSYFMLTERQFIAAYALSAAGFSPEALFGDENHALMVKQENGRSVYLINRYFDGHASHEEALVGIARTLRDKTGARVGVSDTSSSAMDIPSLVEQAYSALSGTDEEQPVALWQQLGTKNREEEVSYRYPYDLLHAFSSHLTNRAFTEAREALDSLMKLLSSVRSQDDAMPDFFIRSVLIDLLSDLAIQMDTVKIKFREYEDLYFRALYLCRSCSFINSREEIHNVLLGMLNVFDEQTDKGFPGAEAIRRIVSENISNPDFSISTLYSGFDISLAYMSHLFKKETGENFSDYLWKARYAKACDLLSKGDMNINEISLAVGYIHPSSFRRKFKQETGIAPTEYHPQDDE